MSELAAVVVVLLVGLALGFGLYLAVRAEHDDRQVMDRRDAEQAARRDTDDAAGSARGGRSRDE